MEIRLQVIDSRGHEREVAVDVPREGCFVREITTVLAKHADQPVASGLFSRRQDRVLSPEAQLSESGLLDGDVVELVDDLSPRSSDDGGALGGTIGDLVELEVVGGPEQGRRFTLAKGRSVVGRDETCDIQLGDSTVSRHHLEVVVDDGEIKVNDAGSSNGSFINATPILQPRKLRPDDVIEVGGSLLRFRRLADLEVSAASVGAVQDVPLGHLPFNRAPRFLPPQTDDDWAVPVPPDEPRRSRFPLGTMVVPLFLGIALYLATKQPTMLLFTALTPAMAIWTFVEDRKTGRSSYKQGLKSFRAAMDGFTTSLAAAIEQEATVRRKESPSAADILRRAELRSSELWERRPQDDDFLRLRVGWADLPTRKTIRYPESGQESLVKEARDRIAPLVTVPSVPLDVSLEESGVVGITGSVPHVDELGRWLLAQVAGLHSPNEVKVWGCFSDVAEDSWRWLIWMPQVGSSSSPPLAFGAAHVSQYLERLRQIVLQRKEAAGALGREKDQDHLPRIVLVFDEKLTPDRSLLREILTLGPSHGVFTIWLGSRKELLPGQCKVIADVSRAPTMMTLSHDDGRVQEATGVEGLDLALATDLAHKLAPLVDVGQSESESSLPGSLALLEATGPEILQEESIRSRWARRTGLSGLVGATRAGLLSLDLREHGPHALLGGTTGSGKSEFLRTLVASLALENSPDRLNFILIDYKGGSAFKDCVRLPHTVGYVTDLDGHLAHRALISLNAELKRRERQLREASCSDLLEMEAKHPEQAPPSMLIIIDEFAALAKELPEFVDGVVDISQRGRSLGIHLLLATQRPAGVITDQIRANTNIRIALRMNDESDSNDVVGVADAARIPKSLPGRGYVRTGHGELTPIQTAYVGARTAIDEVKEIAVRDLLPGAVTGSSTGTAGRQIVYESDLERIVDSVCRSWSGAEPLRPWMPPLPATVSLTEVATFPAPQGEEEFSVTVGVADEPQHQRQLQYRLPLGKGSVVLYGAGGAGKSTLLRTIAMSLALEHSPADVNIYAVDFATRALASLEELPHVGSVLSAGEQDRVLRLLSDLEKEADRRKLRFAEAGVSSYEEYGKASREAVPRIVILVDGYASFAATFEKIELGKWVDFVPRLVADGRSLGMHFVITADRRGALSGALSGVISTRVILKMADPDDYSAFGLRAIDMKKLELPQGRGFVDGALEVQFASIGDPPGGDEDARRLRDHGLWLAEKSDHLRAPPVRLLPQRVNASDLSEPSDPLSVALGLRDEDLTEAVIDLNEGSLLICGPYKSGRTTALGRVATGIFQGSRCEAYLLSPRSSLLSKGLPWTASAETPANCEDLVRELAGAPQELEVRKPPIFLFIDDAEELFEFGASLELEGLIRRGRGGSLRTVVAAEAHSTHRAFGGWGAEIRKDKRGLLLTPQLDVDGDLFSVRLPRWPVLFPPGRGYLVSRGVAQLIQVACD